MEKRDNLCPYIAVVLFDLLLSRVTTLGHESILFDSGGTFCEVEIGLLPHGFSPVLRLAKVCRIFVANTADWAGFADSADS
jgi:hypothetical protein